MKKKTVLALLVMCMAFSAAACGEKEESAAPASESTEETEEAADEGSAQADTDTEEASGGESAETSGRLVSVDNVEDYVTIGEYKGLSWRISCSRYQMKM